MLAATREIAPGHNLRIMPTRPLKAADGAPKRHAWVNMESMSESLSRHIKGAVATLDMRMKPIRKRSIIFTRPALPGGEIARDQRHISYLGVLRPVIHL